MFQDYMARVTVCLFVSPVCFDGFKSWFQMIPGDPRRAVNAPCYRIFNGNSSVRREYVIFSRFFNDWHLEFHSFAKYDPKKETLVRLELCSSH